MYFLFAQHLDELKWTKKNEKMNELKKKEESERDVRPFWLKPFINVSWPKFCWHVQWKMSTITLYIVAWNARKTHNTRIDNVQFDCDGDNNPNLQCVTSKYAPFHFYFLFFIDLFAKCFFYHSFRIKYTKHKWKREVKGAKNCLSFHSKLT